jgi:hypothetical protein
VPYPTAGLRVPRITDDTQRRAACRAFNGLTAEYFRDFGDRMIPAAGIPVHTPEEAIEETLEMMQLFAEEVMPHFREDAAVDETAGVGR